MQILGVLVLIALAGTGLDAVKAPGPAPPAKPAAVAPTAAPAAPAAPSLPIYRPSQPAPKPAVNSAASSRGYNPNLAHPRSPFSGINPFLLDPDLLYPDHLVDYPVDPLGHGLSPLGHLSPLAAGAQLSHLNPLAGGAQLSPLASIGLAESVYGDLAPSSDYLLQEALLRQTYGAPSQAGAAGAGVPGAAGVNNGGLGYPGYNPLLDPYLGGF